MLKTLPGRYLLLWRMFLHPLAFDQEVILHLRHWRVRMEKELIATLLGIIPQLETKMRIGNQVLSRLDLARIDLILGNHRGLHLKLVSHFLRMFVEII